MSPEAFAAKWSSEAKAMHHLGAMVNGSALLTDVLCDFDAVICSYADELLTLAQAAGESGYSIDHLGRLVRTGKLANHGQVGSPRVRRSELPKKPNRPTVGPESSWHAAQRVIALNKAKG